MPIASKYPSVIQATFTVFGADGSAGGPSSRSKLVPWRLSASGTASIMPAASTPVSWVTAASTASAVRMRAAPSG
jgi:hypothetical protein